MIKNVAYLNVSFIGICTSLNVQGALNFLAKTCYLQKQRYYGLKSEQDESADYDKYLTLWFVGLFFEPLETISVRVSLRLSTWLSVWFPWFSK